MTLAAPRVLVVEDEAALARGLSLVHEQASIALKMR